MADDLGYGDVSCYGAKAVQTPAIDQLAREGRAVHERLLQRVHLHTHALLAAHGHVCLPPKGHGHRAAERPGHHQAWHGDAARHPQARRLRHRRHRQMAPRSRRPAPDWNGELKPGPLDIGFDHAFLLPTTNDRVPQTFVEDRRVKNLDPADPLWVGDQKPSEDHPTGLTHRHTLKMDWSHGHNQTIHNGISRIGFYTGGTKARFRDEDLADTWVKESNRWIEANKDRPFFLFFASQDIHVPRIAHERFQGKTTLGPRGDCIVQLDWCVGELMKTLDRLGLAEKTLVVFCSDNGPVLDDGYKDDAVEKLGDHQPAGPYRGGKYSVWEGGTRTPFITRWKGHIAAPACPTKSSAPWTWPPASPLSPDRRPWRTAASTASTSSMPCSASPARKGRDHLLQQDNGSGNFGLRAGDWKLVRLTQRGKSQARVSQDERPLPAATHTLYRLTDDPGERTDVSAAHPEVLQRLIAQLDKLIQE